MITRLRLERFKNFRDAEFALGGFSVVAGTNAAGKSNLRDAFRFLHAVGRGYALDEIFGVKYGEGAERLWNGIRGGVREAALQGEATFRVEVQCDVVTSAGSWKPESIFSIEVDVASTPPRVVDEWLAPFGQEKRLRAFTDIHAASPEHLTCHLGSERLTLSARQPALSQVAAKMPEAAVVCQCVRSMRFFDFDPEALREPSPPGLRRLGDRGQNLASVVQVICRDAREKRRLLSWLGELTPCDIVDFDFAEFAGKVAMTMVESGGRRTPLECASDGTLRFLGLLVALLGPDPARFNFIEELENGVHPARLHLLVQLCEQVAQSGTQIVATTHSPRLLGYLGEPSRAAANIVFRSAGQPDAHVRPLLKMPDIERVLEQEDLSRLFESGWFEDTDAFAGELESVS